MASVDHPPRGFAPFFAAVSLLSLATATLRLKAESWIEARSYYTSPLSSRHSSRIGPNMFRP